MHRTQVTIYSFLAIICFTCILTSAWSEASASFQNDKLLLFCIVFFSEVLDMWPVEEKHDQVCAQHRWCMRLYKRILNADFNAEPLLNSWEYVQMAVSKILQPGPIFIWRDKACFSEMKTYSSFKILLQRNKAGPLQYFIVIYAYVSKSISPCCLSWNFSKRLWRKETSTK